MKTKRSALKTLILILTPTLIISPLTFLDPINWPKQIALFSILPMILFELYRYFRPVILLNKMQNYVFLIALILFLVPMVLNWSGLTRTIWGTWGRNNGLATILGLLIVAYTTSILVKIEEFPRLITLNLSILFIPATLYGLVQAYLSDPLDWSVKGSVFSFFGNTNFASSIFALVSLASIISLTQYRNSATKKVLLTFQSFASFIVMIETNSIQGPVAFLIGLLLLIYFKLSLTKEVLSKFFILFILGLGTWTFISFLGFGPLGETLYQYTLKLRTLYWQAGLKMGFSNPIFGVGVDSYGDFYRQYRSLETIKATSIDLTVNNAHNSAIQIFATLGLIGLTAYLLLFIPALVFSIKFILKPQKQWSDQRATMVTLFVASFSVSLISIDNISIAIITWMLAGAVSGLYFQSKQRENSVTFKSLEDLINSKHFRKRNLSIDSIKPISLTALTSLFFFGSWYSSSADREIVSALKVPYSNLTQPEKDKFVGDLYSLSLSSTPFQGDQRSWLFRIVSKDANYNIITAQIAEVSVSRNPLDFALLDQAALVNEILGRWDRAKVYRERQLEIDFRHPKVRAYYAKVLSELKDVAGAKREIQLARKWAIEFSDLDTINFLTQLQKSLR